MERCPCCNARLRAAPLCPRCQTDLSLTENAEQAAKQCLDSALQHWRNNEVEHCLKALKQSHDLKQSPLTQALFDFILDRQCDEILRLLAQQQTISAKQKIYPLLHLFPHHKLIRQLNDFIDYRIQALNVI